MSETIAKPEESTSEPKKSRRDWFGYIFTTVIGIAATIAVAWYQLYATQTEAAAAELERARAVKQTAVSIVEEQVLNSKKLEIDRLSRLIDQRRRDEKISIPISAKEVVEQAEFNIASSHHLSVERKEEIKPMFDSFYSDLNMKSFQLFQDGSENSAILNRLAKQIQDGKPAEALSSLKQLEEKHLKDIQDAKQKSKIGFVDVLYEIINSPTKLGLFSAFMAVYLAVTKKFFDRYLLRIRHRRIRTP